MNRFRFHALAGIVVLAAFSASAQTAPQGNAAPAASAAPANSQTTTISGCMQENWGRLMVSDNSGTYDVRGSGVDLSAHANHSVTVRGLPDTKAAQGQTTPFYALQVQDTGTCGPNGAVAAAQPAAGQQPSAQQNAAGAQTPTATAQPNTQAATAATPGTAPNAPGSIAQDNTRQTGTSMGPESQPGGATMSNGQPSMENKGTPTAGTPSNSVGTPATGNTPASSTAEPHNGGKIFQGCLTGDMNNYQFKSNGKTYRLQGNTTMLNGLTKHEVEITGEDFNGKAIEVNGARDLGASCSK